MSMEKIEKFIKDFLKESGTSWVITNRQR